MSPEELVSENGIFFSLLDPKPIQLLKDNNEFNEFRNFFRIIDNKDKNKYILDRHFIITSSQFKRFQITDRENSKKLSLYKMSQIQFSPYKYSHESHKNMFTRSENVYQSIRIITLNLFKVKRLSLNFMTKEDNVVTWKFIYASNKSLFSGIDIYYEGLSIQLSPQEFMKQEITNG